MSLNFSDTGKPVAKIKGGKYNGKRISLNPDMHDRDRTDFRRLRIANDAKLQHIPDTTKEREIIYITGPSGSGKSTYTRMFLEEYKKKYKDREIYLFSSLKEDESLDKIKPKRFKICDELWKNPLKVEELAESVVIFDDIDNITNKRQKEAVYDILNNILEVGRHHKITCIVTMHLPTNGRETRRILNEAHAYVYFPHSAGGKIKYLLQEYLDIDKNMIRYFKNAHSRWCCIFKNYPMAYMLEHEIGMLNTTDSDSDGDDGGGQNI
jgi:energy-coupling factor transporter ATP-binding protein EcfA2